MTKFGKTFDNALKWLRENHKPCCGLPIVIIIDSKLTDYGRAIFYPGKRWVIHIRAKQSMDMAVDTLLHEWAHCLQDEKESYKNSCHHTDTWGMLYAMLYRGYHG